MTLWPEIEKVFGHGYEVCFLSIRLEADIDINLAKLTFHSPSPSVSLRLAG